MYKQYFLWSLENIWKTASILIITLAIPISIILAILGLLTGKTFFFLFFGVVIPIVPATLGEDFVNMINKFKDIFIFLIPFILMVILSTNIKASYLPFCWLVFIAICAFSFSAVRYVYINFDELISRQMLYRNSNIGMLDTKWKYVFNRYSHIVIALMYVVSIITIFILVNINK